MINTMLLIINFIKKIIINNGGDFIVYNKIIL